MNVFFRFASRLGDGLFWHGLMSAILVMHGGSALYPVLHTGLTAGAGVLVYKVLKERMVRERPFITHEVICCNVRALDRYSFPSGHPLHAVSFSILRVSYYPGLAWLVIPFAVLVALSRLVLGPHYISDVLAGGLIDALLATASLHLASMYMP